MSRSIRARPPRTVRTRRKTSGFDPLELSQKLSGREGGFHPQDGIEEIGLCRFSDRFRLVKAGQGGDPGAGNLADLRHPPQEVQFPVPHVGTECYENLIVHRLIRT